MFDVQFWWPWTRTVQSHPTSKVMMWIQSPFMASCLLLCLTLYLSWYLRYLIWRFCDLDLGQFKVIQCQRSGCQSKARSWLPIWPPLLCLTLYLSWYLRYLMRKFCDLDLSRMVQGHLRSKVIVPIHSPWATYYSTSVNSNATFLGVHTQGAMTPKFKLGREFCTMHLPPSFIVLCLLVRKLSSWQTNTQTNRRRWKHPTFFAALQSWVKKRLL